MYVAELKADRVPKVDGDDETGKKESSMDLTLT